MHWPRKTRPNLRSRLVADSMTMLRSVQDATKSTWPSLSQYCVSRLQNQNQPCHMVVYFIYELFKNANLKIKTTKFTT